MGRVGRPGGARRPHLAGAGGGRACRRAPPWRWGSCCRAAWMVRPAPPHWCAPALLACRAPLLLLHCALGAGMACNRTAQASVAHAPHHGPHTARAHSTGHATPACARAHAHAALRVDLTTAHTVAAAVEGAVRSALAPHLAPLLARAGRARAAPLRAPHAALLSALLDVHGACVRLHAACACMHPGVQALPGMGLQLGGWQAGGAAAAAAHGEAAAGQGASAAQGRGGGGGVEQWGYFAPIVAAAGMGLGRARARVGQGHSSARACWGALVAWPPRLCTRTLHKDRGVRPECTQGMQTLQPLKRQCAS